MRKHTKNSKRAVSTLDQHQLKEVQGGQIIDKYNQTLQGTIESTTR